MIYVTQGHEKGVGLEIFFKSLLCISSNQINSITLIANIESVKNTLNSMKMDFDYSQGSISISNRRIYFIEIPQSKFQTSYALSKSLELIKINDCLITLPSSKDQIVDLSNNVPFKGHTDYFRHKFSKPEITMNFLSPTMNVLLLTDHIGIDEVSENISVSSFIEKLNLTLNEISKFTKIKDVYFPGINPHCGESGLISKFDEKFINLPSQFTTKWNSITFHKYQAADTILFNDFNKSSLFVFAYHDQGLIPFKYINGLIGINLSLGLPFTRMSVDHGTAFDLYGKNCANYQGMLYLLNEVIKNPTFVG